LVGSVVLRRLGVMVLVMWNSTDDGASVTVIPPSGTKHPLVCSLGGQLRTRVVFWPSAERMLPMTCISGEPPGRRIVAVEVWAATGPAPMPKATRARRALRVIMAILGGATRGRGRCAEIDLGKVADVAAEEALGGETL